MSRRPLLLAAAALLVLAAPASAATRHAAPDGMGATPCLDAALPCGLARALEVAVAGDTVLMAGGRYPGGMSGIAPAVPLTLAARSGETPVYEYRGDGPAYTVSGTGNVIHGVTIRNTAPAGTALSTTPGAGVTVRRSVLDAARCAEAVVPTTALVIEDSTLIGRTGTSCLLLGDAGVLRRSTVSLEGFARGTFPVAVMTSGLVEDSTVTGGLRIHGPAAVVRRSTALAGPVPAISGNGLVVSTVAVNPAVDGDAIAGDGMSLPGAASALRLVNVTAVAPRGRAIRSASGCAPVGPGVPSRVEIVNSIARGATDLTADVGVTCLPGTFGYGGTLRVASSSWTTRVPLRTSAAAGAIEEGTGNRAGDPGFVAPPGPVLAGFDLRLTPGSPALDAGVPAPEAGPVDRDGRPRVSGPAIDMGAHEFPVAPPGGGSEPAPGGGGVTAPPRSDVTAPMVTVLMRGSVARLGRAAVVTARVGEAATMRVAVARLTPGRRRAGRCVAPALAPAAARPCTRLVPRPVVITARVAAGRVSIPLRRLGLRRGTYRVTVTAVDAAGNASPPARLTLRIVR